VNNTGNRTGPAAALAVSGGMIGVNAGVLSLDQPTDMHASTTRLPWFVDACLLVLGMMIPPAGSLGAPGAVPASDWFGS
jgi:hypothetical protein